MILYYPTLNQFAFQRPISLLPTSRIHLKRTIPTLQRALSLSHWNKRQLILPLSSTYGPRNQSSPTPPRDLFFLLTSLWRIRNPSRHSTYSNSLLCGLTLKGLTWTLLLSNIQFMVSPLRIYGTLELITPNLWESL